MRRRLASAVAASAVLLSAACSGDDGGGGQGARPTTTTQPPTRDEFVGAADAVCLRTNEQVGGSRRQLAQQPPPPPGQAAGLLPTVAGRLRTGVAELRGLAPPPGGEAQVRAFLDELDRVVASLDAAGAAAAAGDADGMTRSLTEALERWAQVDEAQREYGFKVCGHEIEEEVAPPTSLTPEQAVFIEQGDAVCRAANREADPALADAFSGDRSRAADGLARAVAIYSRMFDELARLSPPPADAQSIRSILDTERQALSLVAEAQKLAAAGHPYQAKLDEASRVSRPADRALRAYGFTECGA